MAQPNAYASRRSRPVRCRACTPAVVTRTCVRSITGLNTRSAVFSALRGRQAAVGLRPQASAELRGMEVLRSLRELARAGGDFLPRRALRAVRDLGHRDAALDPAHQRAEVAAHARLVDDLDGVAAVAARVLADGLVRAVLAGGVAQLALDALLVVDLRHGEVVEVEVFPLLDVGDGLAGEVGDPLVVVLVHPAREPVGQ